MNLASSWATFLPAEHYGSWQQDVQRIAYEAEARRKWADYDTGSITEFEAYLLRALAEHFKATTVIEVGTFIGTSTLAMASASNVKAVYTCDVSNDCLRSTSVVTTFPKVASVDMLRELVGRGVKADFCFFDGVLRDEDVDLLKDATTKHPVFTAHDYTYGPKIRKWGMETVPRKGIGNIRLLQKRWPRHVLFEPIYGALIAMMVPESRL